MQSPASRTNQVRKDARKNKVWTRRIVFAFFIFIGLVVLLESPLTRIRHIVVSGNSMPASTVVTDSNLRQGMSLWQVNKGAVAHFIMTKEPLVEKVSVHTNYSSGTVSIAVTQKTEVAVYSQAGQRYSLLSDGTVYQKLTPSSPFNVPLVESTAALQGQVQLGKVAAVPGLATVCKELLKTPPSEVNEISEIVLDKYGNATMYLDNGFAVQTESQQVASTLGNVGSVVTYFSGQGYGPGLIDMSGNPPYRYIPFRPTANTTKGK
ncbi:FtsQ-type POTRA domain-containing protein [Alicyclobacillus curvatus]|nr:FtsQ-type POTRA domain-containing protein [Alicyclobacillus curvatus]